MTIKVLLIEDEPDIREVATLALELDPEFEVVSENCGVTALAIAARWLPDAVLLDVMMPVMDGPTTLKELKSHKATINIPVIFLTARVQAAEIEEFMKLGACGVIRKPFDALALAAMVRSRISK